MVPKDNKQIVLCLHQKGKSNREISKLLQISRNTIRKILKQESKSESISSQTDKSFNELLPTLRLLYSRCEGNAIRVREVLKEEYGIEIGYSTLTRFIQEAELRGVPKRSGEYHFEPGVEMQHDTSPHWVLLGDKRVKAQCASLVFGFSRMLYMQYYPCFTRFEAKTFLKDALEFMGGTCERCVIDNTSVILGAGSGSDAVMAPETLLFSRLFGFKFIAHRINHADRKGKIERPFYYIETNFLPGRSFKDWDDLNQQALDWCVNVSNKKLKRVLNANPETVFIQEKPYLTPLPEVMPPIYEHYQRIVDSKAYINLDSNRYSVPERLIGKTLDVYKYPKEVSILYRKEPVATHPRLAGKRGAINVIKGHHSRLYNKEMNQALKRTTELLTESNELLADYVSALKRKVRGGGARQLNRLLSFKQSYPEDAFINAIKQASHYGLYDLGRLEDLIIDYVAGNYFNLKQEEH